MPCSKTSFLKLPSIHRFRCLVLSEIFTHLSLVWLKTYSLSGEQNLWTFDQPTFVPVFLSVRYNPLSSYVYYVSIALCLPPPPPKFCVDYFFQILLGGLKFPKGYENNTLCKICGINRVHYGGFENSQWEGGACAPVAPLPHYSPLRSLAAMGFFWPRTDESTGVENTPYVFASARPHYD